MGPPAATPNWFCLSAGTSGEKKLRAFRALLRRNSHAAPWSSFVPAFDTTFTWDPGLRPYSAEKLWVWMRTSWMASGGGKLIPVLRDGLLKYPPLKVKRFI